MIRVEDLEFQWPGSKAPLLRLPRFELKPGEKVFVHGRSGSGKSTLLNLLTGILPIDQGQIHLLDQPFSEQSSRSQDRFRADHIGLIFQQFNLVPYLTALENVELPLRFSKRRQMTRYQCRPHAALPHSSGGHEQIQSGLLWLRCDHGNGGYDDQSRQQETSIYLCLYHRQTEQAPSLT